MPLKSASMDNVHLRNSKPLKPILKKPFNMQQRLLLNLEFQYGENFGGSTSALPETTASDWAAEYNGDISRQNSHNDLPIVDNGSSIRRLGSTRSISFSMDEVPVIETYSKTAYNRKPDNNITVKKLTPKLKQEIREELNDFKKNEMEVHELSASNTAFH
jgi:hypothetical protein